MLIVLSCYKHQYTSTTLHRNCFDEGCRCDVPEPDSGIPLSGSRSIRNRFPPITMLARAGSDSRYASKVRNYSRLGGHMKEIDSLGSLTDTFLKVVWPNWDG